MTGAAAQWSCDTPREPGMRDGPALVRDSSSHRLFVDDGHHESRFPESKYRFAGTPLPPATRRQTRSRRNAVSRQAADGRKKRSVESRGERSPLPHSKTTPGRAAWPLPKVSLLARNQALSPARSALPLCRPEQRREAGFGPAIPRDRLADWKRIASDRPLWRNISRAAHVPP
jgi:hypothetical protein